MAAFVLGSLPRQWRAPLGGDPLGSGVVAPRPAGLSVAQPTRRARVAPPIRAAAGSAPTGPQGDRGTTPSGKQLARKMSSSVARLMVMVAVGNALGMIMSSVGLANASTATAAAVAATTEIEQFYSGLTASFLLVLASEIGDKTFFISALLALKYSKTLVFLGTMGALGLMTLISVGIGRIFHALPASLNSTIPWDDYAAVALLVWFGFTNIRDSLTMTEDEDEEFQDAQETIIEAESGEEKPASGLARLLQAGNTKVVAEAFSLVFLAEWGDKSMLATVALAAAKSPLGVIVGGISGHLVATIIAVLTGAILGKYVSEKNARLIGGILFLVFAVLTLFGVY